MMIFTFILLFVSLSSTQIYLSKLGYLKQMVEIYERESITILSVIKLMENEGDSKGILEYNVGNISYEKKATHEKEVKVELTPVKRDTILPSITIYYHNDNKVIKEWGTFR